MSIVAATLNARQRRRPTRPWLRLAIILALITLFAQASVLADTAGWALEFDGATEHVYLGRVNSVLGTGWESAKTISVWMWIDPDRPAPVASNTANGELIIGNDSPRTFGITRAVIGGQNNIWVWNSDANGVDLVGVDYTPGEWVHIALVHDGAAGTLQIYKNALLQGSVASGPTQVPSPSADGRLYLAGSGRPNQSLYFGGRLDEVRLWRAVLDASTIGAWMLQHVTDSHPSWANLSAYYQMSDGSGISLTDDSPNSNTGEMRGDMSDDNWVPSSAFGATTSPPIAIAQSVAVDEDASVAIVLTGTDPDEDELTYSVSSMPANGELEGTAPELTYTPAPNFSGTDSFTFRVYDGSFWSSPATVDITVRAINDAPLAVDDTASARKDTPVTIRVLDNDVDPDNDTLTVIEVGNPANGTVSTNGTTIIYTPDIDFIGTDTFSYVITDGNGEESTAQVTVTVQEEIESDAGWALAFDGETDYVRLAETSNIFGPGWETTKSVTLWVKPAEAGPVPERNDPAWCDAIVGDRPRWWGITQCVLNGQDRIWLWNYDGTIDAIGIPYVPNEWVQIGLVHENGVMTAYRNDVAIASVPSGATTQPSTGAFPVLQLGGVINNASRNWTFKGEIDEVRLWIRPLHANEIAQAMNHPLAGDEEGLTAYYQMSDGAGTVLTDDGLLTNWNGTLMDGLPPGVPGDGPIAWVPSGAFSAPGSEAITIEAGTVVIHLDDITHVDVAAFSASAENGSVLLSWTTYSEYFNQGFNLYRATDANGPYERINDALIPAKGGEAETFYQVTDQPGEGIYYYKLEDVSEQGKTTQHGPAQVILGESPEEPEIKLFLPAIQL